jgi:anti-sigma28 factor (negative regulator of flagellin synthesis)
MKIEGLGGILGPEPQKPAGPKPSEKSTRTSRSDSVTFSRKAQDLRKAGEVEAARSHIDALPEIRADKVEAAKAKVESGYYNSAEFHDTLADKLLKDFGLQA